MHVVISSVGSAGDVHPFLAIGQALARRGHEVELLVSPHFRARVEAAGLGFVGLGSEADYERVLRIAELWDPRRAFAVLWREMQPRLLEGHAALLARVRPGTRLVGSTLAWHVRLAQETHGLPAATVHLSPVCIFSAQAPPVLPGLGALRHAPAGLVRVLLSLVERAFIDRTVARGLDALRKRLGLAPVRRVMSHWVHSPDRVVCAWPDWYAPAQSDWPARALTSGFPRWPAAMGEALPPSLAAFLDAGPPPLGFTPGSAMAHGRDFFAQALAASAALGLRAVLVTPFAKQLPQPLPAHVHAVAYAPFDLLLPRLRALVHHGGIGTTAQAFAAGIPQAVLPFAHDQFDNAARLQALGVGVRLRRRGWAPALRALLGDPHVPAACAGCRERVGNVAAAPLRIAQMIEALPVRARV